MAQLERWEEKSPRGETGFRATVNLSWDLLKKYYKETDKVPIYVAGMVLDPRQKMEYFERNWCSDWVSSAKERLRSIYNEYYSEQPEIMHSSFTRRSTTTIQQASERLTAGGWSSDILDIHSFLYGDDNRRMTDELEMYLAERILPFADKEEKLNLTWRHIGKPIRLFILHWRKCFGISLLFRACQQSQRECSVGKN
jgi:hypothetical protein